jgi:hypothetical protein
VRVVVLLLEYKYEDIRLRMSSSDGLDCPTFGLERPDNLNISIQVPVWKHRSAAMIGISRISHIGTSTEAWVSRDYRNK